MVKYQVEISDEAKDALKKIYDWLKEEESLSVAQKVRGGILDAILLISYGVLKIRVLSAHSGWSGTFGGGL